VKQEPKVSFEGILSKCTNFEWRGAVASLVKISGTQVQVLRGSTDWSSIVGDRPVKDARSRNLADLFPTPSDHFQALRNSLSFATENRVAPTKANGPRMG